MQCILEPGKNMAKLILLRHGESIWNLRDIFTGWVDVPLSEKGIKEAFSAGETISDMPIDIIYCSTLVRATMTAMLALSKHKSGKTPVIMHAHGKLHEWGKIYSESERTNCIPMYRDDALNERMYGELQGLNKQKTREQFGDEQVKIWRRSFAVAPPNGESLKMTTERTIPYFTNVILPQLHKGLNIFVSAHGNSLRAIVKQLDNLSDEEIAELEIATGIPLFYEFQGTRYKKL